MSAADPRKATLTINLTPRGERRGISKQAIEGELRRMLEAVAGARINVGFGVFLATLVVTFIIAGLTVGYRAFKAALANPVEALRYE